MGEGFNLPLPLPLPWALLLLLLLLQVIESKRLKDINIGIEQTEIKRQE
jgi:hypothetical protein